MATRCCSIFALSVLFLEAFVLVLSCVEGHTSRARRRLPIDRRDPTLELVSANTTNGGKEIYCFEPSPGVLPANIDICRASLRALRKFPGFFEKQQFLEGRYPKEPRKPPYAVWEEGSECLIEIASHNERKDYFSFNDVKNLATKILEECEGNNLGGVAPIGLEVGWRITVVGARRSAPTASLGDAGVSGIGSGNLAIETTLPSTSMQNNSRFLDLSAPMSRLSTDPNCWPRDTEHPLINVDLCRETLGALRLFPEYRVKQEWLQGVKPSVAGRTPPIPIRAPETGCLVFVAAAADDIRDTFSWESVRSLVTEILQHCEDAGPSAGGSHALGRSIGWGVIVQWYKPDDKSMTNGTVEAGKGILRTNLTLELPGSTGNVETL